MSFTIYIIQQTMDQNSDQSARSNSQQVKKEYQEIVTFDKNTNTIIQQNHQSKLTKAIQEIIQNLDNQKWQTIDSKLSLILRENYQDQGYQLSQLATKLLDSWIKHQDRTILLQYFDYIMMICFSSKTQKKLEQCIQKIIENILKATVQFKWMANMDEKQKQQVSIQGQRDKYTKLVQKWELSIQAVRSFSFLCLNRGLNQKNWQHLWIFIAMMLENSQVSFLQKDKQQDLKAYRSLAIIIKGKIFIQNLMLPLFHNLSLLIRIYIIDISKFMSSNNQLLKANQIIPVINNCSLVMKIIQYILGNQQTSNNSCVKLDCLMLLMTIMQSQFKKCQNYNQILEFTIRIVLYLDEEQQSHHVKIKQEQVYSHDHSSNLLKNQVISQLSFYSGQLIGMIFFRNCEWLIKFCRKEGKQTFLRTIKIFRRSVQKTMKRVEILEQENIVYKRLVLGFCGILKINKFDSILEEFTKQTAPHIIKIIEAQYGWQDDEEMSDIPSNISNNLSQLTQCQFDEVETEWNQQYYNKHKLESFEKVEEVDSFLQSVWTVKNHDNQEIFQSIMNNFDEKQAIVWIAQLERFQNRNQYDSDQSD